MSQPAASDYHACLDVASDDPLKARQYLKMRSCPQELLVKYAEDGYATALWGRKHGEKLQITAQRNPRLAREVIEKFLEQGLSDIRTLDKIKHILRNSNITTADIERLLNQATTEAERTIVLRLTANHPKLPFTLYEEVARHENVWVRTNAAKNSAMPLYLLDELISDTQDFRIRTVVAKNRVYPLASLISLLGTDLNPPNPIPHPLFLRAVMNRLPDGVDFQRALSLLNRYEESSYSAATTVAIYSEDPEILSRKALDPNPAIRVRALHNPYTPVEAKVAGALMGTPVPESVRGLGKRPRKIRFAPKPRRASGNQTDKDCLQS